MQSFEGKTAVVTGAASGIGLALAERFAAARMQVVLADIQQDALDRAVRILEERQPPPTCFPKWLKSRPRSKPKCHLS